MTTSNPICIQETNLSYAWAKVLLRVLDESLNNPPPIALTLTGFENGLPKEDAQVRELLDPILCCYEKNTVDVSALVLFPFKAWNRRGRPDSKIFFKWCLDKFIPRLKERDVRNRKGLYFERMMNVIHYYDKDGNLKEHNQLEYIINWWKRRMRIGKRPRQSGLQASCFDPRLDHNEAPRPGFPCLQQVNFTYDDNGGLAVNAFYPTQWIFDRGYGNYLGLCHLGAFMAHELGLNLVRLNCFVARAQLGGVNKTQLNEFKESLQDLLGIQELKVEKQNICK